MKYLLRIVLTAFVFSIYSLDSLGAQNKALVIGISQYTEIDSLRYADADALEFSQILTDFAKYEKSNITVLLNQQATKRKIVESINKIVRESEKTPFDSFVFMFAGHGVENTLTIKNAKRGEGEVKETNIFLAPVDASTDDNNFYATGNGNEVANETFINKAWLARQLSAIKSKSIFIILDSCYSGTKSFGQLFSENEGYEIENFGSINSRNGGGVSQTRSLRRIKENAEAELTPRKVAYLASSRDDQASAEYDELRHGALSYSIFEYLKRVRRDTSSDEYKSVSIDEVYSNITRLFRETRVQGVTLDSLHQPLLVPIPDYSNVKDMVFMSFQGSNIEKAKADRLKAKQEAARAKAEAEARIKALAEAKAKQEAEAARLRAEQEQARIREEQLAREKAVAAEKLRLLAEAKAKQEAEAARLKAEQEQARIREEQLAKEKADAAEKLRLLAEVKAKQEAEAARLKAEQELARAIAAEKLAREKEEADLKLKKFAEAKAQQEAEATRLKLAQLKAEEEMAKAVAEARAKELAEKLVPVIHEVRMGVLNIRTEPSGLEIYVDGEKRKETSNAQLALSEGRHLVELHMPQTGYRFSFTTDISSEQPETRSFDFYGKLDIASFWLKDGVKSPGPELDIFIDGESFGKSNLHLDRLLAGTHLVEVSYKNIKKSRHIEIRPDSPLHINYSVIREPAAPTNDPKRVKNVVF